MKQSDRRWALVLAAGSGTRLASLTLGEDGRATPKQYCSLDGEQSLLESAIERAERLVPRERIVVVVAREHEYWWSRHSGRIASENWIVQPENKGTAAGVLLPLLSIYARDPNARILLLPSDHYFTEEYKLASTLEQGFEELESSPSVLLVGMTPDGPETDYGWIVPGARSDSAALGDHAHVAAFVEKPPAERARELFESGALWNSFLLLTRARGLVALYTRRAPSLLYAMRRALQAGPWALEQLYHRLDTRDFSRDLLEHAGRSLAVLRAAPCGWTDLGTPSRVASCVAGRDRKHDSRAHMSARALDLSLALQRDACALAR